jgi:hypothetical protein
MKVGGVNTHIYFKELLSVFCLKNLINTKQLLLNFVLKTRVIENGLAKKINPNTSIFNSVITAVQTFKKVLRDVTM